MFQEYLSFIQDLFNKIWHGGTEEVTFSTYLQAVGIGILLLASIVAIVVVAVGVMYWIPKYAYMFITVTANKAVNEELSKDNPNYTLVEQLEKKAFRKKFGFITGFVIVYVPTVIPTMLYIIYLIGRVI